MTFLGYYPESDISSLSSLSEQDEATSNRTARRTTRNKRNKSKKHKVLEDEDWSPETVKEVEVRTPENEKDLPDDTTWTSLNADSAVCNSQKVGKTNEKNKKAKKVRVTNEFIHKEIVEMKRLINELLEYNRNLDIDVSNLFNE